MDSSIPFGDCALERNPFHLLPSTSELSIPTITAPERVPFGDQIERIVGHVPPGEALAALGLLVALLIWKGFRTWQGSPSPTPWSRLGTWIATVVLAGIVLAPTVLWGVLGIADSQRQRHEHLKAFRLTQVAAKAFPAVSWIRRWQHTNPVNALAEANTVEGIGEALHHSDLELALELASWSQGSTSESRKARSAAYLAAAARALDQERFVDALAHSLQASDADPLATEATKGISVSSVHLAIRHVLAGDLGTARRHYQRIEQSLLPEVHAVLGGVIAREEAKKLLAITPPRLQRAVEGLKQAWESASDFQQHPVFLACDLSGAYEALALDELREANGAAAVAALRKAESLIEGSPLTHELFPKALHSKGLREIAELKGVQATVTLEEALLRSDNDLPALSADLVTAWLLRARQELAQEQFDEAVESTMRAHRHSSSSSITADAIASSRLHRADRALRRGQWSAAREDLLAVQRQARFRGEARMRLAHLGGAERRVSRITKMARWVPLPAVLGELPMDTNADHVADYFVYYSDVEHVGSTELRKGSQVVFTRPPEHEVASILIRDQDRNGEFDEFIQFEGEGASLSILDVDADARPDLRLTYRDYELVSQDALSGRVLVGIGSGVIGSTQDPFWAGSTDAYIVMSLNGSPILRTKTLDDTQFPTWNEGVVIDYRSGDRVRLDLWDQDLVYDDWIDSYFFGELPSSGIVSTQGGRAALEIWVSPSELPHGYTIVFDAPAASYNTFRDPLVAIPEIAALVRSAEQAEAGAEFMTLAARVLTTEVLVMALFPEGTLVTQLTAGFVIDSALAPVFE